MRLPRRARAGWAQRLRRACQRERRAGQAVASGLVAVIVLVAVFHVFSSWRLDQGGRAPAVIQSAAIAAASSSSSSSSSVAAANAPASSSPRLRTAVAAARGAAPEIPLVAVLIPARSLSGTTDPSQLALFQHLVPSMLGTLKCDHLRGVRFAFYVGYDAGDAFYDNADHRAWIQEKYAELWGTALRYYPALSDMPAAPPLRLSRYVAMKGAPCWIWNMLSVRAYADAATHFLQLNDDNRMLNECWASNLISVLDMDDGFGVVGPRDINNQRLLTQAMVSRTHLNIFGKLYPDVFRNWYSDDWLSMVYGEEHTTMDDRVVVVNSQTQGTRYKKNQEAGEWLQDEVEKGMRLVGLFRDFERRSQRKERAQIVRPWEDTTVGTRRYVK